MAKIKVQDTEITIVTYNDKDYISLTDMVRNIENGLALIEKWLRNKNTIEFLGIWEEMYNPDFNSPEFEGIKNEAGLNRFVLSVKQWVEKTNSRGIIAKAGRYGGTYAHKDIAFYRTSYGTTYRTSYGTTYRTRLRYNLQNKAAVQPTEQGCGTTYRTSCIFNKMFRRASTVRKGNDGISFIERSWLFS